MKFNTLYLWAFSFLALSSCNTMSLEDDGNVVPLTVLEDITLPSIHVNGVLLHSETYGNPTDPMLVIIHGGPGGDYQGLLNFKQLVDDGMFVVFYDQRGSGLSERIGKDGYSEVQVFIDELGGVINYYRNTPSQKVILAGHSWGAMLATAYINQHPTEITGVILAEPGGFTWEQTEAYVTRSRALNLLSETTNDFVYQDQFITGSDHNTLDYKMALSAAGNVHTGDPQAAPFWRFGAVCNIASIELARNNPEQVDFTANLSAYTTKVLFAYSELNTAYGLDHATDVSSALTHVDLVKIEGCGHEIPHYGWSNFYPLIQTYLTEIL
ncbi:MAG: alpha/beta fold hydrolase [Bacteroidia bacterium]